MFAALINNLNHNFMKKSMFILGAALILGALSCSKGDTGPAGTAGPTGAQGNANVTTDYFLSPGFDWSVDPNYSWQIDAVGHETANLSGNVTLYYSIDNSTFLPVPAITNETSPFYQVNYGYQASSGNVAITWGNITPGSFTAPTPPATIYFKLVAIP